MYDVALMIERELTALDADQVISLHEGLDEPVTYHLLLPVEDAAAEMATSLGALGGIELMATPATQDYSEVQKRVTEAGRAELEASAALLKAKGQKVTARLTAEDPIDTLTALVAEYSAAEAIILTQSHLVAEFFHLDWTSRARRKLDVPTLHLLEHETFDGQSSGGGEGASLI